MNAPILALADRDARRRHYAAGHWRDETLYAIVRRHAARTPERVAVREQTRRLTYAALLDRAEALADAFANHGLRSGERVVTWMPNRLECAVTHIACSRGGQVYCPSPDRNHTAADVVELLRRVKASAFIYQSGFGADSDKDDIGQALEGVSSLRQVEKLVPVECADEVPFGQFNALSPGQRPQHWINNDPDIVRYLSFTSGSTGVPKGVMHSDNSLITVLRSMSADWGFNADTVTYSLSPISHGLGISGWLTSLVNGGEFVLHDLARGASVLNRIVETSANYLVGVPTHAIDLLGELRRAGVPEVSTLKCFRVSGAALPSSVVEGLLSFYVPIQSGYGMSENCAHQYTRPSDSAERILQTCGKVCAGYEVRIFDIQDPDRPLAQGEVGQIGGRGASLMLGYYGDQGATEAAFNSDGWFMTGDLGRQDKDGYLYVTGRMKDLIIRGGHNINPGRIEDFVMRHDAVERAAVFPLADERLGERICLAVMLKPGREASADQILARMAEAGLTRYEMPEYFVQLSEIPVMTNGKVRKPDLVKRVKEGEIVPQAIRLAS